MRTKSTIPRGAGTDDRAWVAERRTLTIREPIHAVSQVAVSIPMRDGLILSGMLYSPTDLHDEPGILIANGYGVTADPYLLDMIFLLARYGYVVLSAKLRGVPPSEGTTGLYERFGTDAYDLIEWLARRPECNGCVGMVGASLLGLVQYLAAREAPPSLKVILPDDAGSDNYWYLWYPGGMSVGPGRAARQLVSGAENEYPLAVAHPDYDAFWCERTVQAQDLEAIARRGIAAFLTSGWDSYLLGSAKSYEWLKAGKPGRRLKMFIGPWGHGAFMSPGPLLMGPAVLPYTGFEYGLMWLDRWLKGISNGVDEEPRVLIYVQGPDEWRFEQDWPLPDERRERLYLRANRSGTGAGSNDGTLSPQAPGNDRSVAYRYSPDGPYNLAAVTALSRPRIDKTPYEAHGLAWTSEPLSIATEMTGYPRISFWCTISATDTDFVVEITDVSSVGNPGRLCSMQVTRGYLNAMRYFSRTDPRPLIPGMPYRFELELYPTSYVFAAGHRIRVTLQGAAVDPLAKPSAAEVQGCQGFDPALLTICQGPGLNPQSAEVTLFQDIEHPSHIELPMVGASDVEG